LPPLASPAGPEPVPAFPPEVLPLPDGGVALPGSAASAAQMSISVVMSAAVQLKSFAGRRSIPYFAVEQSSTRTPQQLRLDELAAHREIGSD
jgi:hypothetical protein